MSINISASTPGVDVIHQIKVGNDNWNVAAKYIWDGSTATTSKAYSWSDITSLVTNAFTVEVFTTLPTLPASPVDKYDHTMALIASQDGVDGAYDEYIIVNQSGTRSWELVGTTKTELAGLVTNNAGGQTVYTTSNGSQTATGSATVTYAKPNANTGEVAAASASGTAAVTYAKPNANTGYNTATTINGSSFGFSGTEATISGSTNYTPQGSVTGSASVASHSHTVSGTADSSRTFVITSAIKSAALAATTATTGVDVPVTLPTQAASAGGHTHSVTPDTTSIYQITGVGTAPALTVSNKTVATNGIKSYPGSFSKLTTATGYGTGTTTVYGTGTVSIRPAKEAYGFAATQSSILTTPTVTSGVLSWNSVAGSTDVRGTAVTAANGTSVTVSNGTSFTYATGALATGSTGGQVMVGLGTAVEADTTTVGSASGWSAGSVPTRASLTVVTGVSATGSAGAHTHSLSGGSVGKMTVTTEAASTLSKAYLTGVNANTGYNTATTIQGSSFGFSGTAKTITVSASYTPQGSITGSATVASHSHTVGTSNTTASGSATVTVPAHSHTIGTTDASASGTAKVAVSNHSHQVTVASHTHHTVAS